MSLWGSTIDPAQAKEYVVPLIENQLPPVVNQEETGPQSSPTKTLTRPTAGLPSDHGAAEGEATRPAFGTPSGPSTAIPSPGLDEGWFTQMSNLISNQKWFFVAVGIVVLFAIGMGIFFWRRAVRRRRANYSSLPADDVALSLMREGRSTGARTKELYDAFGEVSDDEADENTGLRPDLNEGLGFHSSFLDDDDLQSAGPTPYTDEPGPSSPSSVPRDRSTPDSNGSWEHASQNLNR
jgi:kexin